MSVSSIESQSSHRDVPSSFEPPSSNNYNNNNNNTTMTTATRTAKGRLLTTRPPTKQHHTTYEDILLGKYLEKVENYDETPQQQQRRRRLEIDSPYLQKLSHSSFLQTIIGNNQAANSNVSATTQRSGVGGQSSSNRPQSGQIAAAGGSSSSRSSRPPHDAGKRIRTNLKPTKSDSLNRESMTRASSAPMRRYEEKNFFFPFFFEVGLI